VTAVLDRDLVVVSGPDTFSFLQSLVSQDLDTVADGGWTHSLLLTPQGKIDSEFRLVRRGPEEAWLDVEAGFGAALGASLNRFRIRVKATVEDRSEGWGMVAAPGAEVRALDGGFSFGDQAIGPRAALEALEVPGALDAAGYERWRVESGIPRLGAELDDSVIPQEALLDRDAVSFSKGCFLGQELVCRIDTRGHVNKYLRRLRAEGAGPLAVESALSADGKAVGSVTSSVGDVALGYVRREIEPGARLGAGDVTVLVEEIHPSSGS
jgi:folate-binding protein YgfZ